MSSNKLVNKLQKEFGNKIVTASKMEDRRCFQVDNSLDNSYEIGKPIIWHNIRDLSKKGYATVLYDSNLDENKAIEAKVFDEWNSFIITSSPDSTIQKGPTSFRDIYDFIASVYPVIVK